MTSEAMLSHLARWPLFHRRVWEAAIQCCNGPLESRRRKRAAHFRGKMASIYGRAYSLENIQRAVSDLVAWGFLVPVSGSVHAHSGRVYLLAGLDFPVPEGAEYLAQRPHFRRRIKSRTAAPKIQTGSFGLTDEGARQVGIKNEISEIVAPSTPKMCGASPQESPSTPDPRQLPLPIPGDRQQGPRLPIPGDPDKARPNFLARPTPPTPKPKRTARRNPRASRVRGGEFDQLVKAYRRLHDERRSQLTPGTVRRAIANAKEAHPDLNFQQIGEKLIALAGVVPKEAHHPILWAAKSNWAEALAPRPTGRKFAEPAPAPVVLSPEELARQRADLVRLGFASPDAETDGREISAPAPELRAAPDDSDEVEERRKILQRLDRFDRAAWLEAQLAQL